MCLLQMIALNLNENTAGIQPIRKKKKQSERNVSKIDILFTSSLIVQHHKMSPSRQVLPSSDYFATKCFPFFLFRKDLLGSFGSLVNLDVVVHGCVYFETACLQWWLGKLFICPSNNREKVCNYGRITLLFAWFVFRLPGSQLSNHSVLLPTSLWYFQLITSFRVWLFVSKFSVGFD